MPRKMGSDLLSKSFPSYIRIWHCLRQCLLVAFFLCVPSLASAQPKDPPPTLRLSGLNPGGLRTSATDSWGILNFTIDNFTDVDRPARVLAFYDSQPDLQFGREIWVPARTSLTSSMLVGPAPKEESVRGRNIQFLLYDRTDGTDKLVLPRGEEKRRNRVLYYQKREPTSVLYFGEYAPHEPAFGDLPRPEAKDDEAGRFMQTLRSTQSLSGFVHRIYGAPLPPTPEAFTGIDHFVLASDYIAKDIPGMRALRQWLRQGGRLVVLLDYVDPEKVAPLLSDTLDFQIVGRVGLTDFRIENKGVVASSFTPQNHERPVDLVRVQLPRQERVTFAVNGWPIFFTRKVGEGTVIFVTLGPRGWFRDRTQRDGKSPDDNYPQLPVAMDVDVLSALSQQLQPAGDNRPFKDDVFAPLLTEAIGYSVVNTNTVAIIFALFVIAELLMGIALRKSARIVLLWWLTPIAAVATAIIFVVLGEVSRKVEPTVGYGQIVNAVGGKEEVSVRGLLAMYQPESGPVEVGATQGGYFEFDMSGLQGKTNRRLMNDMDSWKWENMSLPAGVRLAPFRFITATQEPLHAQVRFGPTGLVGTLSTGPFRNVSDAIIAMGPETRVTAGPESRMLAVRIGENSEFQANPEDVLMPGQFLASSRLTDRQQRRLELYREFTKSDDFTRLKGRIVLLAWGEAIDAPFLLAPKSRQIGESLMMIPVEFTFPSPGNKITIPGTVISATRFQDNLPPQPIPRSSDLFSEIHIRFQLPVEALPLKVERIKLHAKIDAPSRRVLIGTASNGKSQELFRVENPLDPIRIDITQEEALQVDKDGGLHLMLTLSDVLTPPQKGKGIMAIKPKWQIEFIDIEVSGQVLEPTVKK